MAAALTFGAKKYGKNNYRKGLEYSALVAACERHLTAWNEGEDLDPESGLSHLDHALASLGMLKYMEQHMKEMDDRWVNTKITSTTTSTMDPKTIREVISEEQKKIDLFLSQAMQGNTRR